MLPFFERLKSAFRQIVLIMLPATDFLIQYPCKVVAQNADGSLDLQPDDPRMPSMQHVPIRLGLPGCSVTVQTGSRVLLGFGAPGPADPYAGMWDGQSVVTGLVMNNGSQGAARVGDPVTIAFSDINQFIFTAPSGGGPCVVTGAIVGTPATKISDGSSVVKIG